MIGLDLAKSAKRWKRGSEERSKKRLSSQQTCELTPRQRSKKVAATDANRTHTQGREAEEEISKTAQETDVEEVIWLPPRDSNPDMLIQSQATLDFPLFLDVPGSLRNVMQAPF